MGTRELKEWLVEQLELTAEHLLDMALSVSELEARGEDLGYLGISILPDLRRIARGELSARAWLYFIDQKTLFDRVSTLPLKEQEKLAKGTPVNVVLPDGDVKKVDPRTLDQKEIAQVFKTGAIRPEDEQAEYIEKQKTPVERRDKANPPRYYYDYSQNGVYVRRCGFIEHAELVGMLGLITKKPNPADPEQYKTLVTLTASEVAALDKAAKKMGWSRNEAIRRAMVAVGFWKSI